MPATLRCYQGPFRRPVELSPDSYWAWIEVGAAFEGLAKYDEAIKAYEAAKRIDPNASAARQHLERLGNRHNAPPAR